MRTMSKLPLLISLAAAGLLFGCAHGIRNVEDCKSVAGEHRVSCSACTLQNKADGWLGMYEYQPDKPEGSRCVRLK